MSLLAFTPGCNLILGHDSQPSLQPFQSHPAHGPWHEPITLTDKHTLITVAKTIFLLTHTFLIDLRMIDQKTSDLPGKISIIWKYEE